MDYVNQMQKSGAFSTTPTPSNPRPFNPAGNQSISKPIDDDVRAKLAEIQESLSMQKNKTDRLLGILQNRIDVLEKEVSEMKAQLEKMGESYSKIKDKEVVEQSREALFNRKDREPSDKPIDRNNVAPSQVQIANIFNMSGKRF